MTPSSERRRGCPLDHGNWGHLRPPRRAMFGVGLRQVREEITLFEFNYIPLIYWTAINKHTFRGRAILREGFLPRLSPFVSLACSLHFIINWHKPFFEVQEPSWGMTAQQTMNKTQKDNEHCLNIQVSHRRMGRGEKKEALFYCCCVKPWMDLSGTIKDCVTLG